MKNMNGTPQKSTEYAEALEAKIIELESKNIKLEDEKVKLEDEKAKLQDEKIRLQDENVRLELLNKWYHEQFRLSQHRRFGASAETTVLSGQLGLFNEAEAIANTDQPDPEMDQVVGRARKKRKGKREEVYSGIPTEQIIHELPESQRICPDCGGALHACGHDVNRRELEVIPAQVRVLEHVQTTYACRDCEKNSNTDAQPMVKASVPAPVISGSGIASPSLVALTLCNKYVLGVPLYRQEQEWKRIGIYISRQTMSNWAIFVVEKWLKPIYVLLCAMISAYDVSHADETTLTVVNETGRKASQKSYMWVYRTGRDAEKQLVLLEYQQTREGKHPLKFLDGYKGYLHVDAYAGYRALEGNGVILVECWAHVRRKFDEALKSLKKEDKTNSPALIGLSYCNKLFELEREYDQRNIDHATRKSERETRSKSVAEAFFAWAESIKEKEQSKSKLMIAVSYALNQKSRLMNFFLDGRLEISNNRAERAVRPFAVGRKNWLFCYCANGAEASAIVYSLVETAQANGLVPFLYLNYLFETLPNIPKERFSECLPWSHLVQQLCRIPSIEN